jgi:hypothetical protein
VIKALGHLGFEYRRTGRHILLTRRNADGTASNAAIPNHAHINGSTLRRICTQAGIGRDELLKALRR